eukprot:COSAG01_NODE_56340_length_319_cov_0.668182_1_plen_74_part_10
MLRSEAIVTLMLTNVQAVHARMLPCVSSLEARVQEMVPHLCAIRFYLSTFTNAHVPLGLRTERAHTTALANTLR